ncbi:hypothetical protein SAMN05444008_102363 [Cnuella takakiae]|uniref:Microcystin-dependent protein n=1 Tax=Cnuella takakiae TaxID=1302690 RepID=A0A1M4VSN7_9BACT|nr:phage tail protein [Cnuella takakiae]OLY92515.1 hypothetical protein BUE76_11905 [Cnuella takakiae]SHE71823.1 hypothetical protein SAMN05444008_102363 [Cnuella takakiae]
MPLSPQLESEIAAYVQSLMRKVRIPELPQYTLFGELSLDDRLPLWMSGADKTVWLKAQDLRTLILTGGSQTVTPVLEGDPMIYIVPLADAGTQTASIPSLAGKRFFLRRDGRPLTSAEFDVLAGGGFKLKQSGDILQEGERYDYQLYRMEGSDPGAPVVTGTGGGLFTGVEEVTANKTLTPESAGKLQQLRSGATQVTLTLTDIASQPANSVVVVEASISNNVQNRIAAPAGGYIYMNGAAFTELWLSPGESVWLFRDADGYYVIGGDLSNAYRSLAKPYASYNIAQDELRCNGQVVLRQQYPRLWAIIQTLGPAVITEQQLAQDPVNKAGCFTTGDGSTTFRLPNLDGVFLRGIKPGDTERAYNNPGGYQGDQNKKHNHVEAPFNKAAARASDLSGGAGTTATVDSTGAAGEYRVASMSDAQWTAATIEDEGGSEARPKNVGIYWVVKF